MTNGISPKVICPILVAGLISMLITAIQATPPAVGVDQLSTLESGSPVRVHGIVADVFLSDSGYTKILLADAVSGALAEVWSEPTTGGESLREACRVRIGDKVLVEGRVSATQPAPVVFTTNGQVSVISESHNALTVDYVCENWRLFEGDRLNISGCVTFSESPPSLRLCDEAGRHSIRIELLPRCEPLPFESSVVLDCALLADLETMTLFLSVWGVTPENA